MLPERMAFDWMRSTEPPFGEFRMSVPSERWVGSALQREVAATVPLGSKEICAAWLPTSCKPELV